jgi:hypothetical protein
MQKKAETKLIVFADWALVTGLFGRSPAVGSWMA